jgi:hypothetical protein
MEGNVNEEEDGWMDGMMESGGEQGEVFLCRRVNAQRVYHI